MKRLAIQGGLVVVVLGLLFGAWQVAYARGKDDGRTEATAIRTEFTQARPPAAGGAGGAAAGAGGPGGAVAKGDGAAGPGGAGRGGLSGTVEKVDGKTVTVAGSDGAVNVTVGDRTRINRQVTATVADLKPGDRVVVIGEKTSDTEYTASAIQVQGQ
jgi:hypothetical protein